MSPTPEQYQAAIARLTAVLGGPRNGCGEPLRPVYRPIPRPVITPGPESLCRGDN